jgi:hypothetical protein
MTNPTSNFGWQMPTATDLVTDLPADFAVFGQAVDTSMADLKGGTTGQILAKATNTDMDFTWVTNDVGDITAVTAGTGISGGGTSGAVTITNDMATTITASGDIVVGTGSGTYDNLPLGTTGQVLTADTTVSPYKVKWATPASGSTFVGCALTKSVAQSIANASEVTILFDTEDYDTDGFHSTSSNTSRITIPTGKGGKYLVTMQAMVNSVGYPTQGGFNKNGANLITTYTAAVAGSGQPSRPCVQISQQFSLAAGDYIELFIYQATGAAADVTGNNYTPNATRFAVQYLGA